MPIPARTALVLSFAPCSLLAFGISASPGCSLLVSPDDLGGATAPSGVDASSHDAQDDSHPSDVTTDVWEDTSTDVSEEAVEDSSQDSLADGGVDAPAACTTATADCDGNAANGCETDITESGAHCGACGHDCLGGECRDSMCQPVVLASGQESPMGVTVDTHGAGRVYWTNRVDSGSIRSVAKSGGTVTEHATGQALPSSIALDGNHLFWVTSGLAPSSGTVASLDLDVDAGTVSTIATGQDNPFALALRAGRVFWTNSTNLAGSVRAVDTEGTNPVEIATGQKLPTGIAADVVGVYWANLNAGEIRYADPHIAVPPVALFLDSLSSPVGVAVDQVNVYWTEFTGSVYRATKLEKVATACAINQDAPLGIAVDAVHVYWSNYGGGSIMRTAKAAYVGDAGATQPTVLASDQNGPTTIALDADAVYWTNGGDGTVMRLAK